MYKVIEIPQQQLEQKLNDLEAEGYSLVQLIPDKRFSKDPKSTAGEIKTEYFFKAIMFGAEPNQDDGNLTFENIFDTNFIKENYIKAMPIYNPTKTSTT